MGVFELERRHVGLVVAGRKGRYDVVLKVLAFVQGNGTTAEFGVDDNGGRGTVRAGSCGIGRDVVADPDAETLSARVEDEGETPDEQVEKRGCEVDGLYISMSMRSDGSQAETYSSSVVELGTAAQAGKHKEATHDTDPEEDHADTDDLLEAEDLHELGTKR